MRLDKLAVVFVAAFAALQTAPLAPVSKGPPLRVLVIAGGAFHAFQGNLDLLLPGVAQHGPFEFTRLNLGAGAPPGDVGPDVLANPALPQEYDAILAYTQGELGLTAAQKAGLLAFVSGGDGFVGLHCAADSHPGWTAYVAMLGGAFQTHPPFQAFSVALTPEKHPITLGEPPTWAVSDEFYHLTNVTADKTLLIDGKSPGDGATRPVAWARRHGEGRVFYTILGHGPQTHSDPRYQEMVARALIWSRSRPAKFG